MPVEIKYWWHLRVISVWIIHRSSFWRCRGGAYVWKRIGKRWWRQWHSWSNWHLDLWAFSLLTSLLLYTLESCIGICIRVANRRAILGRLGTYRYCTYPYLPEHHTLAQCQCVGRCCKALLCSNCSISKTVTGVKNSFRMLRWCLPAWCPVICVV